MKILFQDEAGELTSFPTAPMSTPVVEVVLRFDLQAMTGPRDVTWKRKYVALIDTGADLNCIDPGILADCGLPIDGLTSASGVTSTLMTTRHVGHLFFPEAGKQFETDFVSVPLRQNGARYDVIIGRLVLHRTTLIMNYLRRDFRLEFSDATGA